MGLLWTSLLEENLEFNWLLIIKVKEAQFTIGRHQIRQAVSCTLHLSTSDRRISSSLRVSSSSRHLICTRPSTSHFSFHFPFSPCFEEKQSALPGFSLFCFPSFLTIAFFCYFDFTLHMFPKRRHFYHLYLARFCRRRGL